MMTISSTQHDLQAALSVLQTDTLSGRKVFEFSNPLISGSPVDRVSLSDLARQVMALRPDPGGLEPAPAVAEVTDPEGNVIGRIFAGGGSSFDTGALSRMLGGPTPEEINARFAELAQRNEQFKAMSHEERLKNPLPGAGDGAALVEFVYGAGIAAFYKSLKTAALDDHSGDAAGAVAAVLGSNLPAGYALRNV